MADFGISYRNNNLEITLNFIEILSLGNIKINISLFNSVMWGENLEKVSSNLTVYFIVFIYVENNSMKLTSNVFSLDCHTICTLNIVI